MNGNLLAGCHWDQERHLEDYDDAAVSPDASPGAAQTTPDSGVCSNAASTEPRVGYRMPPGHTQGHIPIHMENLWTMSASLESPGIIQ